MHGSIQSVPKDLQRKRLLSEGCSPGKAVSDRVKLCRLKADAALAALLAGPQISEYRVPGSRACGWRELGGDE
jgi:hypothetical protein